MILATRTLIVQINTSSYVLYKEEKNTNSKREREMKIPRDVT